MIVSHKHKYVFIQFPHTACTAVGRELFEHYEGEAILFKHAAYHDFLRIATPEMKKYFVFSTIRNPLDELVSFYYKLKSNHGGDFTRPERLKKNGGWVTPRIMKRYEFLRDHNPDFIDYIKKFYVIPYANWSILDHKQFDYVMRYENLQEDFSIVLKKLGIEQVRPIPVVNPTKKDDSDILSSLSDTDIKELAWVIHPLLQYLDYEPMTGNDFNISTINRLAFKLMCMIKGFYWRRVRHLR